MASRLKSFNFKGFAGGYNSFSGSRSQVKDDEIPSLPGITQNIILDDNGSPQKRSGFSLWSGKLATNSPVVGLDVMKFSGVNAVIAASGTGWYNCIAGSSIPMTGKSFVANQQTTFCQAAGALFGANGSDNLCYTLDGFTVQEVTTNGKIGTYPVFYNQRIYMLDAAHPDRVYYSNTYGFSPISAGYTNPTTGATQSGNAIITTNITGFDYSNLFVTDLSAQVKKNAGFIAFLPGAGVEINALFVDQNDLFAYTKRHGIWKINPSANVNNDGTITHNFGPVVTGVQCPAPRSVAKVAQNDQYFYGADNIYSRGEVQYYASPRVTTKSGRVQSEMRGIVQPAKPNVASIFYLNKVYVAYQTGGINDTIIVQDTVLNAWSTPIVGIPVSMFVDYTDNQGFRHLLAGSSDPTRPYLFELNVGGTDGGTPISAAFESKSSDLGSPGLVKYAAFIDVFYQLLSGSLDVQVIGDEATVLATFTQQQAVISSGVSGFGTQVFGTFVFGNEYIPGAIAAAASYEGKFRVDTGYKPFQRISVRFSNNRLNEQFKINNMEVWYKPGSIYQH